MKMKRLFVLGLAVMFMFGVGNALAGSIGGGNGEQPPVIGEGDAYGVFGIDAEAYGWGISWDKETLPFDSGISGGIAGAYGKASGEAAGFVSDGVVGGNIYVYGGGLTNTISERGFYRIPNGKGAYVGSTSYNYAETGGHLNVNVDPQGLYEGYGVAGGAISGFAAQGSLDVSFVNKGPFLDNDGRSAGIAGQGSFGWFEGEVFVASGPDYNDYDWQFTGWEEHCSCWGCYWVPTYELVVTPVNSYANAGVGAGIEMRGFSSSLSWRETQDIIATTGRPGVRESMGTNVWATTDITSYGYEYENGNGLGYADADISGGWIAIGGAATHTQQDNAAEANAYGVYFGMGDLNQNYSGSAVGYSATSVTTYEGMTGQLSSASAGMQVQSNISNNQPR